MWFLDRNNYWSMIPRPPISECKNHLQTHTRSLDTALTRCQWQYLCSEDTLTSLLANLAFQIDLWQSNLEVSNDTRQLLTRQCDPQMEGLSGWHNLLNTGGDLAWKKSTNAYQVVNTFVHGSGARMNLALHGLKVEGQLGIALDGEVLIRERLQLRI